MPDLPETCLLCGGALVSVLDGLRDHRLGTPEVYAIHRCTQCGAEQTLPRPVLGAKRRVSLKDSVSAAADATSRYGRFRDWLRRSRFYRLWLRLDGDIAFHLTRGRGRLLAFGSDDSRALERYWANGFTADGWQVDRASAAQARAQGFTVHAGELAQFQPATLYDVIVLSDVLQRSLDPRATLRELGRLLAPGGELWIALPNGAGLLREVFGRYWRNWQPPLYALHFTPDLLRRVLAESGFIVRPMACVTPTLWLTESIMLALYSQPGKPTERLRKPMLVGGWMLVLRAVFFPTLFFLNRALRGDCLVVRARKSAG